MSAPTVSVVMSVYNGARYLRQAIDSILGQTFRDFEFIIINDGSTDRSGRILDRYARRDGRIRVIHQENTGLTRALNRGVAKAKGELIARMDADDISLPQRFEQQVAFLNHHPEVVAVGSDVLDCDGLGWPISRRSLPTEHSSIDSWHLSGRGGGIMHPAAMLRRSAFAEVGGYDEDLSIAQDYDLWLRLAEVACLGNIPEVLLRYRLHPSAITAHRAEEQSRAKQRILRSAYRRRGLPDGNIPVIPARQSLTSDEWHYIIARRSVYGGHRASAWFHIVAALAQAPNRRDCWRLLLSVSVGESSVNVLKRLLARMRR